MNRSERNAADQHFLSGYLADRDEPCPLCGYNLRGLTGDHCPECGKKLALLVGLEDPILKAFVAGLVGLASFFGFSLLTLVWFVAMVIILGPGPPESLWGLLLLLTIVSGALLLAWIKCAPRIRRLSRPARVTLALLCLLAPVAGVVSFVVLFTLEVN